MRYLIYILMGFSIGNNTIPSILSCVFSNQAVFLLQSEKYITPLWLAYGILTMLLDLVIWSIPLPSVFSIMHNLSTKRRIALVLTFTVGMMSWCSAILRIVFRKYVTDLAADPTYTSPIILVLFVSEISLAMSCVSLATLQPLVAQIMEWFNRLRGKPTSTTEGRTLDLKFGTGSSFVQSKESGPNAYGSNLGIKGRFGIQELAEWKDDDMNTERTQFSQQGCHCPCKGGDVELGITAAHASPCPRCPDPAHLQVSTSAANNGVTHRSSSCFSKTTTGSAPQGPNSQLPCEASESTTGLTNADTNLKSSL